MSQLTADACILAMTYRVLHSHCYQSADDSSAMDSLVQVRGHQMYGSGIRSEILLARAVHLLTLGAYAWDDSCSDNGMSTARWRNLGGGDIGSVFHDRESAPNAFDWVFMALLREPSDLMDCQWYRGKENTLTLLRMIGCEGGNQSAFLSGVDPALRSGAAWLCDFAAKINPIAVAGTAGIRSTEGGQTKDEEQERKKMAAKEKGMTTQKSRFANVIIPTLSLTTLPLPYLHPPKAMAAMRLQMAKFAANIAKSPGFEDDVDCSRSSSGDVNETSMYSTPIRNRSGSESETVQAMDLSPGDFIFTSPIASPITPFTPRTPHTPNIGGYSSPRTSYHASIRLMKDRPQCIVCGADDPMQVDDALLEDPDVKRPANSPPEADACQQKILAFCGYIQASTVVKGGDEIPTCGPITKAPYRSHVGVHITLCGHAIHKGCCDAYLKTVVAQRDDRFEGGGRREFRCPLCQRLSNCLVPFVDVAADWADRVTLSNEKVSTSPTAFKEEEGDDVNNFSDREIVYSANKSLHDFLSTSEWWAARNDASVSWDGHCTFSAKAETTKHLDFPILSPPKKMQVTFGKKELISAWNSILRTPRLVKRRVRSFSADFSPTFSHESESRQSESNNSDVLRRFLDQVSRADLKVGEETLFNDFGEFRHYLSEKAVYNKVNRGAGKEMVDVSPSVFRFGGVGDATTS